MSNTEALRLAAELRRHARKLAQPAGDTPAVMVQAADALESLAQPAATVVERADSATGVVECGSLNVSDNALPAPSGEPVAWIEGPHGEIRRNLLWKLAPIPPQSVAWSIPLYTMSPKATSGTCTPQPAPTSRLKWMEAPRRSEWGAGMMEALAALGPDETLRLYAHRDAVPMADALLSAQPAPARVPLTDAQIDEIFDADPPGASRTAQRLVARAIEAAHGITAPGAPDAAPNVRAKRADTAPAMPE